MKCACPCGREFEPKRSNQIYFDAEHRKKDKNRRWPRVSAEMLAAISRDGLGEQIEAVHRSGTAWGEGKMAQRGYALGKRSRMPIRSGAELQSAEYLTTRELADLLHVSLWGLLRWRHDGDGPPFVRLGRNSIRYPRVKFEAWLASRRCLEYERKGQQ